MERNVALIGLGPHAKRIYLKYCREHNIKLVLLVELKSRSLEAKKELEKEGFSDVFVWTLPDKYADKLMMPLRYERELSYICKKLKITHMISSTEPKGHHMYLYFAIKNNIHILSDKPILVTTNMTDLENIRLVRDKYYKLLDLYERNNCNCKIMCQRLYHRGYIYIKKLLREIVMKYNIPITYIDIYHCDGNWEMPHDLNKENHPYKYGYGKLYHSGFHFIDLLGELLKINQLTTKSKHISWGKIYGNVFVPNDEKVVFNSEDFQAVFPESKGDSLYQNLSNIDFSKYGEKNFYGQLHFYNCNNALITTANLNLLHYGFSRRGWFQSRDYYKSNGRVRHERVTINVGPLLTIHVHSYQSKEIKDRRNSHVEIENGGLEHFDIDIYRNVAIIGGKAYERIKLSDLYKGDINTDYFIGFNEQSREEFLNGFFNEDCSEGDLKNEALAVEILYSASKTLYNRYNDIDVVEKIKIPKEEKENNEVYKDN